MRRKVYTRPATVTGELGRALLLLAFTLVVFPLKLVGAVLGGIVGGTAKSYKASRPRKKSVSG